MLTCSVMQKRYVHIILTFRSMTMQKSLLLALSCAAVLTACDNIGSKTLKEVAKSSQTEQEKIMQYVKDNADPMKAMNVAMSIANCSDAMGKLKDSEEKCNRTISDLLKK